MGRQMFAKGGAAFPDLSGDGNVTQKDILMGRGVIPMQDGGMAPMPMPAAPGPQMTPPGMPPIDPNSVDINQAAQGAMQQGIDPAMLEGMLTQYAGQMEDLDNAEDYETVINGIRGDSLPIEQRYQELATVVGPEDSQATPESVLTLLQPVMQIAMVDQGIGGLAAEEMSGPVEGAMAEGIMSTVNMGAPEAPVQVPGGPASVNFNQGGAVQYMAPGGVALSDPRLQTLFDQQRALTSSIYGEADQEAALAEQQKMTEAQMLFDVAQGALGFAGGAGRPGASPAEQLAAAFTPVIGNIGQRAGELGKFKQAQKDRSVSLDLSNLQTAQAALQSEKAIAADAANVKPGDSYKITDAKGVVLWQGPVGTVGQQQTLMAKYPNAVNFTEVKETEAPSFVTFINPDDTTDFHTFDANNLSTANITAMEGVRQSVNAEGKPLYRITGNYTPKSDSGTAASIVNFINPTTRDSVGLDVSTPAGKTEAARLLAEGYEKAGSRDLNGASSTAKIQTVVNKNNPRDIKRYDLNDPKQRADFNALDDSIYVATAMPSMADLTDGTGFDLGNSYEAKALKLISNADTLEAYSDGTLDETTANLINNYLTNEMRAKPAWDPATQTTVMKPGLVVSSSVMNAINARGTIEGASLPTIGVKGALDKDVDGEISRVPFKDDGTIDFSAFEDEPLFIITGIDLTKSQGVASTVNRFFNMMGGQIKDVSGLGSGYAGNSGKITSQADTQLNALARNIMQTARQGVDGRIFALEVALLEEEVNGFKPGGVKTDNAARDQLVTVRNNLAMMYREAEEKFKFSKSEKESTEIKGLQESVGRLIAETTGAIAVYDKFLTTDPIAEAQSDRSSSSVTGGLSRASNGEPN